MKSLLVNLMVGVTVFVMTHTGLQTHSTSKASDDKAAGKELKLGNFSISLAVKDIEASRAFYEKLGFKVFDGTKGRRMYIMQNDTSTIGLFQGMFPKNMLTYNPGWDRSAKAVAEFDDVRAIQRRLKEQGITPSATCDEQSTGPAFIIVNDPDGNQILIDQHVPKPKAN